MSLIMKVLQSSCVVWGEGIGVKKLAGDAFAVWMSDMLQLSTSKIYRPQVNTNYLDRKVGSDLFHPCLPVADFSSSTTSQSISGLSVWLRRRRLVSAALAIKD
jgi:hypothetical protein